MTRSPRGGTLGALAVGVAVLGLVLTACGDKQVPTSSTQASAPAASTPAATIPAPPSDPIVTAEASQADMAEPSSLPVLSLRVDYVKGTAPISFDRNSKVDVDRYLLTVWQSYLGTWRKALAKDGVTMPSMTFDITNGSDRYVSHCTDAAGQPLVVIPSSPATFYCPQDGARNGNGAVALPATTLAGLWQNSPSRKVGDLAVAIATTRQAGLIMMAALPRGGLSTPFPEVTRHYGSLCLAGAWAHGAYDQRAFTDQELTAALQLGLGIPSQTGADISSVTDRDQRAFIAWTIGYRSGDAGDCLTKFQL
jgi:hypothetical protein